MKKIRPDGTPAFQGDVMFRARARHDLPSAVRAALHSATDAALHSATDAAREHVVAHSETGHHHVALGGQYIPTPDPFVAYLVAQAPVRVEHRRSTDTHETLELLADDGGDEVIWEIRRQREHTPEGWRRVED